jgi:hypothetical protein
LEFLKQKSATATDVKHAAGPAAVEFLQPPDPRGVKLALQPFNRSRKAPCSRRTIIGLGIISGPRLRRWHGPGEGDLAIATTDYLELVAGYVVVRIKQHRLIRLRMRTRRQ